MKIGDRLRVAREAKGITLSQAARAARLSVGHLCHLEKGDRRLTAGTASRLLEVYGAALDSLLGVYQLDLFLDVTRARASSADTVQAYLTEAAGRGENPAVWRAGEYLVIHASGKVVEVEEALGA